MNQKLLQDLVQKEMKRLKKICYKYQKRVFLLNDVVIAEDKLADVSGVYEVIEEESGYGFTHKITIDTKMISNYINYKRERCRGFSKKYFKELLINEIRYELIRAFCMEHYERYSSIKGTDSDASPFFLAILYFVGGTSNNDCIEAFFQSKIYQDTKSIKTFTELGLYLTRLYNSYENAISELKEIIKIDKKGRKPTIIRNNFSFSSRASSLHAKTFDSINVIEKDDSKVYDICNYFEIGFIMAKDIKKLAYRKIKSENFKLKEVTKEYILDKNNAKTFVLENPQSSYYQY